MKLDDDRWETLEGGHGVPYDPRPALAKLELEIDHTPVWQELWENLHHEGSVGVAAYAAIPHLVRIIRDRGLMDWTVFALAGTLELARESGDNADIPPWLVQDYDHAWEQLFEIARGELSGAADSVTLRCLLAVIAIAKGDHRRGAVLLDYDDEQLDEMIGQYELGDDDN